ncbi:MAG: ATP-binding cassette domain-containing protein [Gammaproteobacteria bacterium]|jgi:ABC-2 type transport system ATP-binding protein|nr:ATP-binding cassette domain-containing protein [Gammaproteobacteria bacterium]
MSLITVNNIVRYYGHHRAVDDISFTLKTGDILGFLGPNGAGKSSTMQMLSGNLAPSAGEIHIHGFDLLDNPKRAKAEIGYLPEQPPLYKEMTVDEYLRYCARLHRIEKSRISDAINLAKTRCGLTESGRRLIGNLSKGYQQRVGIAQAIVHAPRIIILDEPTVGLDPNQIREIRELIVELGKEHGIILCTHILPEVEAVCNRVQIINKGRLVYEANMDELRGEPAHGFYEVTLLRPPGINQLYETAGINNVERLDERSFLLHTSHATAENIADVAVANNWGLIKLIPYQHTLEQIFIDLTLGDEHDRMEARA